MVDPIVLSLMGFLVAATVLTVTPGVDTAMVLRSAAAHGPRAGVAAGLGICVGLFLWGAGAAFGLTALLAASELAFTLIKWLGAAYLVYLGIKLLIRPRTSAASTALEAGPDGDRPRRFGPAAAFRRGFLTNILNPKVGVFYVTFLPQFIPPGSSVAGFSLLLTAVHVALTLVWFAVLIALTVPLGRFLARPSVVKALDRLTGCVFVAFGVRLAATQRV